MKSTYNKNLSYTAKVKEISPNRNMVIMDNFAVIGLEHFNNLAGHPILGKSYHISVDDLNVITQITGQGASR